MQVARGPVAAVVHIQAPTPLTARGSSRCCVRTTGGHGGVRDGGGVCADPDATACVVVRVVPALSTALSSDFFFSSSQIKDAPSCLSPNPL
jgi:hypothetical protein